MISASRYRQWRMCATVLGASAVVGLFAAASAPARTALASAPASVTATCHYVSGHGPKGDRDAHISNVVAQSMTCTDALKAIYKGHFTTHGFATPDFGCHEKPSSSAGNTTGGTVSCKASPGYGGHGDFRFTWTG